MDGLIRFIESLIKTPFVIAGWVIVGILAGWLARKILGGKLGANCLDLFLGLAGALVGGFIMGGLLDINGPSGGLPQVIFSLIVATIGAIILILIGRVFSRRASTS